MSLTIQGLKQRRMSETEFYSPKTARDQFETTPPVQFFSPKGHHKRRESTGEASLTNQAKNTEIPHRTKPDSKGSHKKTKSLFSSKEPSQLSNSNIAAEGQFRAILPLNNNFLRPLNPQYDLKNPLLSTSNLLSAQHSRNPSSRKMSYMLLQT